MIKYNYLTYFSDNYNIVFKEGNWDHEANDNHVKFNDFKPRKCELMITSTNEIMILLISINSTMLSPETNSICSEKLAE